MNDSLSRSVLALNVGSSSLKFGLYKVGASGCRVLLSGAEEAVGVAQAVLARIAQRLQAQGQPVRLLRSVTESFMVARSAADTH